MLTWLTALVKNAVILGFRQAFEEIGIPLDNAPPALQLPAPSAADDKPARKIK